MIRVLAAVALFTVGSVARAEDPNTLTPAEQQAGWRLLFDGRTTQGWRGYKSTVMPAGWRVENGSLLSRRVPGESSGDIITLDQFADFELVWEWKMTAGNNSGVIYRATEEKGHAWETGPEYQLLDNQGHVDDCKTTVARSSSAASRSARSGRTRSDPARTTGDPCRRAAPAELARRVHGDPASREAKRSIVQCAARRTRRRRLVTRRGQSARS